MAIRDLLLLGFLTGAVACAGPDGGDDPSDDGPGGDAEDRLDPAGDEDGDGFTNSEESAGGSDPFDATDVPYAGGWKKGDCRDDIAPTGDAPGQIAGDFALIDQYGEQVHLHDFCDRTVMLEFSGFT